MKKTILAMLKSMLKPLVAFVLVVALVFGNASGALAASRAGGRIGGGSFRAPSRTYSPPSRTYQPAPRGGYYPYGGGGYGAPFIVPSPLFFVGGGFGGLFTLLVFVAVAGVLIRAVRGGGTDELGSSSSTPSVSVARIQVGLLADARYLQADLNRLATTADTGSTEGLTQVLQEATLSLLRHPEYWIYAGGGSQQTSLMAAEAQFNRLSLAERSKFSGETLSNVNKQLRQAQAQPALPDAAGDLTQWSQAPGEYLVATVLVATQGKLDIPAINGPDDLRRALSQLGSVSSDRLLAVEVLWTPQAEGETLTADELISEYPDLKRV